MIDWLIDTLPATEIEILSSLSQCLSRPRHIDPSPYKGFSRNPRQQSDKFEYDTQKIYNRLPDALRAEIPFLLPLTSHRAERKGNSGGAIL